MAAKITDINQLDPGRYYTYQDYLSWQFRERVELMLGRLFRMSPAPSVQHQRISMRLTEALLPVMVPGRCQLFAAPFDVRLPVSKVPGKSDTVVQPDLTVICDPSKLDEQGCNGAPDLVVEILSPGNTRREMKDKFEVYEASLIPEYWIVDPEREDILVYSFNDQQKYIGSKPFVSGEIVVSGILPGLQLDPGRIFTL